MVVILSMSKILVGVFFVTFNNIMIIKSLQNLLEIQICFANRMDISGAPHIKTYFDEIVTLHVCLYLSFFSLNEHEK